MGVGWGGGGETDWQAGQAAVSIPNTSHPQHWPQPPLQQPTIQPHRLSPGSPKEFLWEKTLVLNGQISCWVEQELCPSIQPGPHSTEVGISSQGSDTFSFYQAKLGLVGVQ